MSVGKRKRSWKPTPKGLTLPALFERFPDPGAARAYLEQIHWPDGPTCPHCGNADAARVYRIAPNPEKKIRSGLLKCAECRKQFTVTVGTIFEDSKIPLNKWLIAVYLMCSSKKGISAHQIHRMLGVTYKTAWFMLHRIRYAMSDPSYSSGQLGGGGKIVEADETWIGGKRRGVGKGKGWANKTTVVSLGIPSGTILGFSLACARDS